MWGGVPSAANICNFFRCRKCVQGFVVGGVEEIINVMDGVVPCVEEVALSAVAKPYREFGVSWCINDYEAKHPFLKSTLRATYGVLPRPEVTIGMDGDGDCAGYDLIAKTTARASTTENGG